MEAGLRERYGEPPPAEAIERMDMELGVIERMGYCGYFLIVWDFIAHAKSNGIAVGPGRGSAAGSLVAYCLRITDLDPLRYDLLFERFLNPERVSMPDIDIDFSVRGRERVMRYVIDKYGTDRVAQIITFGKMFPRAATRDAARVLGYDYGKGRGNVGLSNKELAEDNVFGLETQVEVSQFLFQSEWARGKSLGQTRTGYYLQPALRIDEDWIAFYRLEQLESPRIVRAERRHLAGVNFRPFPQIALKGELYRSQPLEREYIHTGRRRRRT